MMRTLLRPLCITSGLLAAALLAAGGCSSGKSAPAAEFVQQADAIHASALAPAATGGDPQLSSYVQSVGRRVIDAAKAAAPQRAKNPVVDGMQFHLVKCDALNAVTTGGGHCYVYSALLAKCETEDDLAAALSVPIAHAINLDLQISANKPNTKGSPDKLVAGLMDAEFTPAQENEALRQAAAVYSKGGWDPAHFNRMLSGLGINAPAPPKGSRRPPEADELSFVELRDRASALKAPDPRTLEYLLALPNILTPTSTPEQASARAAIRRRLLPPPSTIAPTDKAN